MPYHIPPFDKIKDEHFVPAIEAGMREQLKEVDAIAASSEKPTFDNTVVALERTGRLLDRAERTFSNLNACNTNPAMQKIEKEMAPKLSAHRDAIHLNGKLFARIEELYNNREKLGLDPESTYLLERYYKDFVRAGAKLSDPDKEKLKKINAELATLQTDFEQNVLKEKNASSVVVDRKEDLAGLSDSQIAGTVAAAKDEHKEGKFVIRLQNTTGQPLLGSLQNRPLRQRIMDASLARNSKGGEFDTRNVVLRTAQLRAERAKLLGYENHAAYQLEDQTAGNVPTVNKLLADLAPPAVANARREAADMQKIVDEEKGRVPNRVLGLGFLFRESAQSALRLRRIGAAPVLRAESRPARRRLLRRRKTLRPHLQGTARSSGLSARRARVRSLRCRRQTARLVSGRLLRASFQTRRRLDERLRPAKRIVRDQTGGRQSSQHSETARRASRRCSPTTKCAPPFTNSATRCTECFRT